MYVRLCVSSEAGTCQKAKRGQPPMCWRTSSEQELAQAHPRRQCERRWRVYSCANASRVVEGRTRGAEQGHCAYGADEVDEMSSHPDDDLTPAQIAELKRQLQAANARLIAVERRRQELRELHCNFDGPVETRWRPRELTAAVSLNAQFVHILSAITRPLTMPAGSDWGGAWRRDRTPSLSTPAEAASLVASCFFRLRGACHAAPADSRPSEPRSACTASASRS